MRRAGIREGMSRRPGLRLLPLLAAFDLDPAIVQRELAGLREALEAVAARGEATLELLDAVASFGERTATAIWPTTDTITSTMTKPMRKKPARPMAASRVTISFFMVFISLVDWD